MTIRVLPIIAHPRPEHALQLCFYSHAVEQIQKTPPEMAYVVFGTRDRFPIRLANWICGPSN
jgi:hypothetical protein